jgi:hypothetical protein
MATFDMSPSKEVIKSERSLVDDNNESQSLSKSLASEIQLTGIDLKIIDNFENARGLDELSLRY